MQKITAILARGLNWEIGKATGHFGMPWPKIPADLKNFQEKTKETPDCFIGPATLAALGNKPLSERRFHLLSRSLSVSPHPDIPLYQSIEEGLTALDGRDCMVIGGAKIYESFKDYTTNYIITVVHGFYPDADCILNKHILNGFIEDISKNKLLSAKTDALPLATLHYYSRS